MVILTILWNNTGRFTLVQDFNAFVGTNRFILKIRFLNFAKKYMRKHWTLEEELYNPLKKNLFNFARFKKGSTNFYLTKVQILVISSMKIKYVLNEYCDISSDNNDETRKRKFSTSILYRTNIRENLRDIWEKIRYKKGIFCGQNYDCATSVINYFVEISKHKTWKAPKNKNKMNMKFSRGIQFNEVISIPPSQNK